MDHDDSNLIKNTDKASSEHQQLSPQTTLDSSKPNIPINSSLIGSHQNSLGSQPSLGSCQGGEEEGSKEALLPPPEGQPQQAQENEHPMDEPQENSEMPMNLSDHPPPPPPSYEKAIEGQTNEGEQPIPGNEPEKPMNPQEPPQYGDAVNNEQPLKKEGEEENDQNRFPPSTQEGAPEKPFEPPKFEAPPQYSDAVNNEQPLKKEEEEENDQNRFSEPPPTSTFEVQGNNCIRFEAPHQYGDAVNNEQPLKKEGEEENDPNRFSEPPPTSTFEVRSNCGIHFEAPPQSQGPPPYSTINPSQGDEDHKGQEGAEVKKKENRDEVNTDNANKIINFIRQYTDKFSSIGSIGKIQESQISLWGYIDKSLMRHENEKTKECIKAEYDRIVNRYVSDLEEAQREMIGELMENAQTEFIHEVVLQKMLKIEPQSELEAEVEYETIKPDQLFERIVSNVGRIPLSFITQLPPEDCANFVTVTPQFVAQNLSESELGDDDDDGRVHKVNDHSNGNTQINVPSKEELKLEEFLGCINNVLEKAKSLKILQIKKLVFYNTLFARYFVRDKEDIESSAFETGESILANAFKPREGLEPFYTFFIRNNIMRGLSLIDKEVPPNTPENDSIKKLFWEVVNLIHQKQNSQGAFKYFRIVKPEKLSNLSLQEFTAKINADLETFLDIKFTHSVVPFEYNGKEMMIYATNDPSIYNRVPGFPLVIDDVLCRIELCDSFYLKADSLDFSGLMHILSHNNLAELDVEYFATSTQKYFLIVFPVKELVDLFVEKKDDFIPKPSEVAPNTENENINKAIEKIAKTTTNTRALFLESTLNKITDVSSIINLSSCWDAELWKRHYTRVHPGDEEYRRKLRVFAAGYGNIIFEKGHYKKTPRSNPSDLSLFAIKSETQNVHLSNAMRLIDGYMICEKRTEFPSFEGVEVLEGGGAPTLDFLLQKGNAKTCVYALLLSGKESLVNGWKTGAWGGECGDEVELLYRTTLQKFLDKKMGLNSLFYEGTNTVYFKNVVVYRAGAAEGFAMYEEMAKVNVVVGLMPEGKGAEDVKEAWRNVIGTAVEFGAKSIVVGGRKENAEIVRDILGPK